ncbi:MAG TPA: MFS transporter [Rhodanobacteraceae bacterium]|nr:MFS transporter [Rhodanobacteraceae bacterium]
MLVDKPSPHTPPRPAATAAKAPGGGRAWAVWAAAAAVYLVAMFHRSSLSVAGIAAAERFHIGAAELSSFTVLQLVVYAGMQLPVGVLLDRYGSRRLLATGLTLMTVGQLGFALVPGYVGGLAMRALVGAGDAMSFLSVLRLVAAWFPPLRNPLLTQLTSLSGQLGALITAVPMAAALARFGWSSTFIGAALLGLSAGVGLLLVVRDHPQPAPNASAPRWRTVLAGLRASWREPGTRLGVWAYFTSMFFPSTLLLLWGYPWLVDAQQLAPAIAARLLSLLTLASMASAPLFGHLLSHRPGWRLPFMAVLVTASAGLLALVLAWPGAAPVGLLAGLLGVTGVGFSGALVAFDFARETSTPERLGTALALVNVGGFTSTVLALFGVGLVLDLVTPGAAAGTRYGADAYRLAMTVPFALWGVGAAMLWRQWRTRQRR